MHTQEEISKIIHKLYEIEHEVDTELNKEDFKKEDSQKITDLLNKQLILGLELNQIPFQGRR